VEKIMKDEKPFLPILQALDIRTITAQPSGQAHGNKYRVTVSDGSHTQIAYVATQSSMMFADHTIQNFYIIRLTEYCTSVLSNRKFIIITRLELVQPFSSQIGNPVPYGTAAPPKPEPAAPAAVPPSPMKSTNKVISSPTRQGQKVFTEVDAPAGITIIPVKNLHPYQNIWTIRVRVTNKSAMKEFTKKTGGTGKLFSVELIDEAGDEIRGTAFTEVAEKLFDILEVGHVYLISKGELRVANKKFTTIAHQYEITFNSSTTVQPVADDASTAAIPSGHFSFVPIEQIAAMNKDDLVDVLGVVTQAGEVQNFVQKSTGRDLTKRTLTLLDNTAYSIEVTLWGDKANTDGIDVGTTLAVRAARVGTFNGKSLSTSISSQIMVSPDIPEAKKLATWYQEHGAASTVVAISDGSGGSGEGGHTRDDSVMTIATALSRGLGKTAQGDFFTCVACITTIRHDKRISYTACPNCGKKVEPGTDGQYFCAKCNQSMPEASEVYSLNMQIADHTGSIWASCFRNPAMVIMGNREPAELIRLQTEGNEAEFNMAFDSAAHQWYSFRIRARLDTEREDVRTSYLIFSATPIDYTKECQRLVSLIDSYP